MWDRGTTHSSGATFRKLVLSFSEKDTPDTSVTIFHDDPPRMDIQRGPFFRTYPVKEEDLARIARLAAFQVIPVIPGEGRILDSPMRRLAIEGTCWKVAFEWDEHGTYPHWENLEHLTHAILGLASKNTGWTIEDETHHLVRLYPEMHPPWQERYAHL